MLPGWFAQFAVVFLAVVVGAQRFEELIGWMDLLDVFGGQEAEQAALPGLMVAFDFAFGLGRGGIAEMDFVEVERGAELGEGFGDVGEEEAVVVDVEFQWQAVLQEGAGEEVQVGLEVLGLVEPSAGVEAGAIIEHVQQMRWSLLGSEPRVRSAIKLPEFADGLALPAPLAGPWAFGEGARRSDSLGDGVAADAGSVDFPTMMFEFMF